MMAMAELCAEQGYEATKIADLVRRAGVARKTLYDNFDGKEEVFLAAFDTATDEVVQRIEDACEETGGEWIDRVAAGLRAFLGYVAENPASARMCMVEAVSATPAASDRYDEALQRFVELAAGEHAHRHRTAGRRSRRPWSEVSPGSCTSRFAAARPSRSSI